MKSVIFFISGKSYTKGRNLEPLGEPYFSLHEIKALLTSFFKMDVVDLTHEPFRILKVKVPAFDSTLVDFLRRAVTIHYVGTLDHEFVSSNNELLASVRDFTSSLKNSKELRSILEKLKKKHGSFWIDRIFHAMKISPAIEKEIKTGLGSLIENEHSLQVESNTPELKISVFISRSLHSPDTISFIISLEGKHFSYKGYNARKASNRAAFKIGTMNPPLTSFMMNFSHPAVDHDSYVLDPFCGTGGILIEALVRGFPVIGMDVESSCTNGCVENLTRFNDNKKTGFHVVNSSIFHSPLRESIYSHDVIDIICTDPPYGNVESLRRQPFKDYVKHLLSVLKNFETLTFACPDHYHGEILPLLHDIEKKADIFTLDYFEHRSLSRRIYCISRRKTS
ncbi:MAG: RsmD family RNA methyltransferase [Candidatus Hodarchaeota archaeon]